MIGQKKVMSTFNIPVRVDQIIEEINIDEYDALAIPGGFEEFGVNVINKPIVIDNNIITSYCPATAVDVAFKLLEKLTSTEQVENVKKAMGF